VASALPVGVTLVSTTGCAEDPAGSPTCTLPDLTSGASASFTLDVTIDPDTVGTITYNAGVTSDVLDPVAGNDQDSEDTLVEDPMPDLTVTKSNDVGGQIALDGMFSWTLLVENTNGDAAADFAMGDTVLRDELPDADLVYGGVVVTTDGGTTGTVDCAIAVADLVCTATTAVSVPVGGSVSVEVPAGPTAVATYDNPRAGGVCAVDPDTGIDEIDEGNNSCSDSVDVLDVAIFYDGFEEP
jgi:hypothetical protein